MREETYRRMKPGAIVAMILTVVGLVAVVLAFQGNSSQYVSVNEALASSGTRQHLSGDIVPGTIHTSLREGLVAFTIKDEEGQTLPVVYYGPPPQNLAAAAKVVAVGGVKDGNFEAVDIITKCPSKYESTK